MEVFGSVVEFERNREEAVYQTIMEPYVPAPLQLSYAVQECSDTVLSMTLTLIQFS